MKLEEIKAVIELVTEHKALIQSIVDDVSPDIFKLAKRFVFAFVDIRAGVVHRLIDEHGFTREEAIAMSMQMTSEFKNSVKTLKQ